MMLLQIIGKPWFNFIVLCIEKLLVLVEHSHRKCINLILVHMRGGYACAVKFQFRARVI